MISSAMRAISFIFLPIKGPEMGLKSIIFEERYLVWMRRNLGFMASPALSGHCVFFRHRILSHVIERAKEGTRSNSPRQCFRTDTPLGEGGYKSIKDKKGGLNLLVQAVFLR